MILTQLSYLLRNGDLELALETMLGSCINDDILKTNPLINLFIGNSSFILANSSDCWLVFFQISFSFLITILKAKEDKDHKLSIAYKFFLEALNLTNWNGLDECVFLLVNVT